ncbi:MAG TPA: VOC family protein [Desulfobacteria bacterium]|nr:VOC family protein [Desulfobacteria bacterium]
MSDWLTPYITFNGNCEEAVKFYQQVLGGELVIMHLGDAPAKPGFTVPDNMKNLVLHAELRKDGHVIRFSDNCNNTPFTAGNNISFALQFETKEEVTQKFKSLSEGGAVQMEPQQTFFSPLYAKFTDKFGMIWQLICNPQ